MILKSLSFENFRSFKERTGLDLRKVNVFVGPNKGGKSNVIKCLEILNSLSRNDWNDMYNDNVFDYDNTKRITIEVEFYLNTEERQRLINIFFPSISLIHYENNSIFKQIKYHITFGNNEIHQEKVSVSNTKGEYRDLIIHGLEGGSHNQHVSNLHSLSETKDLSEFDTVSLEKRTGKWLKTNSMLHVSDRTSEYELADIIISFFRNVRIYSSANIQSTINFEEIIKNKHDKAVRDYINFLNLSGEIIDISDIQIDRDKPAVPIYDDKDKSQFKYQSLGFKEKGLSSPLNFRSLSYGTQQLLHILILIHLAESEQTVCIEEPENHIHSNVQKRLFTKILDVSKTEGLQFFITTHSPIFTTLENDIVATYLVTRSNSNGISKVTLIENESQLKLIKQHLGIDNSDIYLSPYVIFVEGDSEEISIPIVAKALGFSQIGKEVRIINLKGKDKIQRLTEFLKYITYFGTEAIVIADGHKSTNDHIEDLKRSKLNFHPLIRGKDKEFEDLFNSKIIVEAMKNLSLKKSLKFEMNEDELENKRKATNVARILEQYMRDNNNGIELDKKSLAGELSSITIKEMNKKEPNREKTGLEKEIEYVMNIIYPHNK